MFEGGIGPQPHPNFVDFFSAATFDDRDGAVARAGEDWEAVSGRVLPKTRSFSISEASAMEV